MLTVNALWVHGQLSQIEQVCLRSWLFHDHKVVLWTYLHVDNVPEGVEQRSAWPIFDPVYHKMPGCDALYEQKGYAGLSDVFRYYLMARGFPGWWVDTDVVCLRNMGELANLKYVFGFESKKQLGTAVVRLPQRSSMLTRIIWILPQRWKMGWNRETGPKMLTEVAETDNCLHRAQKQHIFFPLPYQRWEDFYRPDKFLPKGKKHYTMHLWNDMGARVGFDKNQPMPPNSIFGRIAKLVTG